MQGIKEYECNGVHVLQIHYTADVDKQSPEWKEANKVGMSDDMWDKEYEIKWNVILGKAWFTEFNKQRHVASVPLKPTPGRPIFRGWDYGLTPATVFAQTTPKGQLLILAPEIQSWDNGITAHGLVVRSESNTYFPGYDFHDYGDPAGNTRSQNDEKTANDILRDKYGIHVQPGPVAELARHEAIRHYLTTLTPDGEPMILIDPRNTFLIQALGGGYQHKEVAGRYLDIVADNEYTHIVDALGYMTAMVGGGQKTKWEKGKSRSAGTL
jgi:hypothetical protein